MQGSNYIEAQDILNATNGGLDIIFHLYPDAMGSDTKQNRKFKVREEKTPSASLKRAEDGNWLVTDFGSDSKPRNAVQCYAHEKNLKWVEALRELASNFNVVSPEKQQIQIRSDYSDRAATPDEAERTWSWQIRNSFTDAEIEAIISKKVLSSLGWKSTDEEKHKTAYNRIAAAFKEYRWHPLESYSLVKDRKVMTFSSNEQYPIFMIDEGTHKKIYQPKNADKSRRFLYIGDKPKDFIHGLEQLSKAYEARKKEIEAEMNEEAEDDDRAGDDSGKKKKKTADAKLPEVVLCSGGSDAINVALLGYRVIWMNSETAKLFQFQYDKINIMVQKFYQLPDIDATGKKAAHELNMQYLDLLCIELPDSLKKFRDNRGNECKDVRDYLNYHSRKDFKQLVDIALPYRFWEQKARFEGRGDSKIFAGYDYEFDNVQAYNFLLKNGFGRLPVGDKKSEWIYVRKVGNVVHEQDVTDIKDFIRDFLRDRLYDKNLRNAMFRTTQLGESSLTNLDKIDIDFSDNTPESQFFFFRNRTVEITKDEIKYHRSGAVDRYIWSEDLLQHNIEEPQQAPFTITRDALGTYDIEIHDKNCPFLKYLVQTSRVHWRKELEERMKELAPVQREEYLKTNHCVIDGPNLTPEEIEEQKQHLVNKLFTIGYLLHRYKSPDKGWFAWGMDNKINDDGKSHGGSGKSLLFDRALRTMMPKNFYMNGRNPKLTDDPHKYDGLSEHHRYILVDDGHEYLKLDSFYTDITGDVKVNPKGKQPYIIPFSKSGKFAFTTNYTPRDLGPSTERRMLYCVFSDYYHNKGETDDYNEYRDPKTDLGIKLFYDFDKDQWNSFYTVMLHALKFFLGTEEKIKPAMENVNKRNLMSLMGNLHDWALVYLSEESGRLDKLIIREEAFTDYMRFGGSGKVTPQQFSTKMKAFCRYYGYVLNPIELQDKNGKIIKKVEAKTYIAQSNTWEVLPNAQKVTKEMFYIQTKNTIDGLPESDNQVTPGTEENKLNF